MEKFIIACQEGRFEQVQQLVESGAVKPYQKIESVTFRSLEIVEYLVRHGWDLSGNMPDIVTKDNYDLAVAIARSARAKL